MIRRWAVLIVGLAALASPSTAVWPQTNPAEKSSLSDKPISAEDRRRVTRFYTKGNRFLDAKRFAEAERAFLDALKLAPEMSAIHHGLGLVYIQTLDYELAVLHLEEALRREPENVKTIYALSRAYASVGENEKALEGYKRAIQLNPAFEAAHQELAGIYYREKKWDEALVSLETAKAINPLSAHTLMLIGVTGIHAGRPDVALGAVTELRSIGKQDQARRLEYLIFSARQEQAAEKKTTK